jgi:hypothetical protein
VAALARTAGTAAEWNSVSWFGQGQPEPSLRFTEMFAGLPTLILFNELNVPSKKAFMTGILFLELSLQADRPTEGLALNSRSPSYSCGTSRGSRRA